ncbi:MAG: hypothetical protein ACKPKO_30220, partial [Candidatus Fonsibacter sp.]
MDSVLAEFREQHIAAADDLKVAVASSKKQGSVGDDGDAIISEIVARAGAGEPGDVVADSAVAGSGEACEVFLPYLYLQ